MTVAKIYLTMMGMLLDYLEIEKETLIEKDSDNNLLSYYNLTEEYIKDRMAEELSLMWWRIEFDLKQKAKEDFRNKRMIISCHCSDWQKKMLLIYA